MVSAPRLLLVDLDDVVVLHVEGLWGVVVVDASAVEEEAEGGGGDAHPVRVRLLQLPHQRSHLHPEVHLVAVLTHHLRRVES